MAVKNSWLAGWQLLAPADIWNGRVVGKSQSRDIRAKATLERFVFTKHFDSHGFVTHVTFYDLKVILEKNSILSTI